MLTTTHPSFLTPLTPHSCMKEHQWAVRWVELCGVVSFFLIISCFFTFFILLFLLLLFFLLLFLLLLFLLLFFLLLFFLILLFLLLLFFLLLFLLLLFLLLFFLLLFFLILLFLLLLFFLLLFLLLLFLLLFFLLLFFLFLLFLLLLFLFLFLLFSFQIIQVHANDKDSGHNAKISYDIVKESYNDDDDEEEDGGGDGEGDGGTVEKSKEKNYFSIDSSTGWISMAQPFLRVSASTYLIIHTSSSLTSMYLRVEPS